MQIVFNNKTVRSNTIQDLKVFNTQSPAAQAKKGEHLVAMMPAIKKAFDLMGDDIVDLSTENGSLKNKIGFYDEKLLEESESEAKLFKQIDDEEGANFFTFRMGKKPKKQN